MQNHKFEISSRSVSPEPLSQYYFPRRRLGEAPNAQELKALTNLCKEYCKTLNEGLRSSKEVSPYNAAHVFRFKFVNLLEEEHQFRVVSERRKSSVLHTVVIEQGRAKGIDARRLRSQLATAINTYEGHTHEHLDRACRLSMQQALWSIFSVEARVTPDIVKVRSAEKGSPSTRIRSAKIELQFSDSFGGEQKTEFTVASARELQSAVNQEKEQGRIPPFINVIYIQPETGLRPAPAKLHIVNFTADEDFKGNPFRSSKALQTCASLLSWKGGLREKAPAA